MGLVRNPSRPLQERPGPLPAPVAKLAGHCHRLNWPTERPSPA